MILYVFGGLIWSNRKIKELKKKWLSGKFRHSKSSIPMSVIVVIQYLI
jgi:hypothetical protein